MKIRNIKNSLELFYKVSVLLLTSYLIHTVYRIALYTFIHLLTVDVIITKHHLQATWAEMQPFLDQSSHRSSGQCILKCHSGPASPNIPSLKETNSASQGNASAQYLQAILPWCSSLLSVVQSEESEIGT